MSTVTIDLDDMTSDEWEREKAAVAAWLES
jgi:hypothetical protein